MYATWILFEKFISCLFIIANIALDSLRISTGFWMKVSLKYTLGFLYIRYSGSANAQLSGCFCSWTFSLNNGLNMLPLDSFMSFLHSLLGYSTGEFQALQLIVLAAFGAVI